MKYLLYDQLSPYYDLIYAAKDYEGEARYQVQLIEKYKRSSGRDLLEMACGTGRYLEFFARGFTCTGLDLNPAMLRIARKRVKQARLVQGDMLTMKLGKQFDVVACLFSSIGYVRGSRNLRKAIRNFADHLKPGGVMLISPWISKEDYNVGMPHLDTYESKDIKIARAVVSRLRGRDVSLINFNWMIAERNKPVQHVDDDIHELTMHSHEEFMAAMSEAGLRGRLIRGRKAGRGLYVGVKSR
ncbi:MAG TPA: class I SAM-dependent methyltransferase [Thermoanaerobaculia bacterium]|nr:class I SAM-dependent methyltransferase [Thermoanaerobaculia bacterium]